jgi:hypothetical protein
MKNDLREVDKETFECFESPYEVIFCILSIEKCDFNEVA